MTLFIVRPEPGATRTARAAQEAGFETYIAPLFAIAPRDWSAPPASNFDGVLIGSANAIRKGGAGLDAYTGLPCYAVGEVTGDLARERGFTEVHAGASDMQHVVDGLAGQTLHLLRLSGEHHTDLVLPQGITTEQATLYAAKPVAMSAEFADALRSGGIVLLHSARAARHFAAETERLHVDRAKLRLACLSPRIASAAGEGWADMVAAEQPNDRTLLALAQKMAVVS